ncbi:MAG: hypothetical protein ACKVWR_08670, partial [Acidimicrobiales bacterium]
MGNGVGCLNRLAVVPRRAPERRRKTCQPAPGQDDHRVGAREAFVERAAVVAVGDPSVASEELSLALSPLVSWRLDPARLP